MWHVSSRSGVATLRTAIHLLVTYLLLKGTDEREGRGEGDGNGGEGIPRPNVKVSTVNSVVLVVGVLVWRRGNRLRAPVGGVRTDR